MRRGEREAKIGYHNRIIRAAWELYLKREADDYRRNLSNAAMQRSALSVSLPSAKTKFAPGRSAKTPPLSTQPARYTATSNADSSAQKQ